MKKNKLSLFPYYKATSSGLVSFTEEILNEKLHFLCCESIDFLSKK